MKNKIIDLIIFLMPRWLKEEVCYRLQNEQFEIETQKHWYKARRAGYKKQDMGFYYADIEAGKHTDFLGNLL